MSYPAGSIFHRKLPPDAVIRTRQPVPPETSDRENPESPAFLALAVDRLYRQLGELARQIENKHLVVDEYQSETLAGDSAQIVTVQPTYEYAPEKIETIIINGPANGQFTLQVGDRVWSMTLPAAGILVLGPLGIFLGRNDTRQLTAQSAGDWFLELTGYADRRFEI